MSEREVVLKLGIKTSADLDAPFKELSKAAKEANEDILKFGKGMSGIAATISQHLKAYQDIEKSLLRQKDSIAALNVALDPKVLKERVKLTLEEEAARKRLSQATKEERAAQGKPDREKPGALMNLLDQMGSIGVGYHIASSALNAGPAAYRNSFDQYGQFSGERFGQNFGDEMAGGLRQTPLLGSSWGLAYDSARATSKRGIQERDLTEAQEGLERMKERASIQAAGDSRRRSLEYQGVSTIAQLRNTVGMQGPLAQAHAFSARETELRLGGAGTQFGIGREAEQSDILRRGQFQLSQFGMMTEHGAQFATLGAQRQTAAAHERDLEQRHAEAVAAENRTREGIHRGPGIGKRDLSVWRGMELLGGKMTGGQVGNGMGFVENDMTKEQHDKKLADLQSQMAQTEALRGQLEEARSRRLALETQAGQMTVEQGKQRLGLLQQEHNALTSIVQQETMRKQSAKEQLGLMLPHTKQYLLQLSRKHASGQELGLHEIEFLKGHSNVAGEALQKIGAARAGPEADEIARNFGMGQRGAQAAGDRLNIENKINIEIKNNGQETADQILDKLLPKLDQADQITLLKVKAELAKREIERQANGRGQFGK